MKKEFRRQSLFSAVILLAVVIPACSDADSPSPASRPSTDASGCETADDLIRQLRSANRNPNPNGDPSVGFPEDYDWAAQTAVEDARRKLTAFGKDAFPMLIDHVNDPGYSLSSSTSIMRAFSVGEICFMILEDQVDPGTMNYKSRTGSDGNEHTFRGYFSQFGGGGWYSQNGLRTWWREHKQMTLREMQVEALRWRIERERTIGFPKEGDTEEFLQPLLEKLDAAHETLG